MQPQRLILGNPLIVEPTGRTASAHSLASKGLIASRGNGYITFGGDGHLITVAPTGAGKGRAAIIPNLLTYPGSVIVIDPKGENYNVTSRARRAMGQQIVRLDPFHLIDDKPDNFNPFDILEFTGKVINDEVRGMFEAILAEPILFKEDPFWDEAARSLVSGLALYLATSPDTTRRNLSELRSLLYKDDVVYNIAKTLDSETGILQEAYEEMSTYLQGQDRTRADILMTAQQYFRLFGSPSIRASVSSTTFDIEALINGEPVSIYIVLPPSKIVSHRRLLRVWVGALLSVISARRKIPAMRTLFLLDEAAQLGYLRIIETAITLLRGYGLITWSFWQDLSQLKKLYPNSWESIFNNCSVIQLFGNRNFAVAKEFASIVGVAPEELKDVARDEQTLVIDNEGPLLARKLDYLRDDVFKGRFDPNPHYQNLRVSFDE